MMRQTLFICVLFFLFSCGEDVLEQDVKSSKLNTETAQSKVAKGEIQIIEPIVDDEVVVLEKDGISLTEIKSEKHLAASVHLNTKKFGAGKNQLSFSVSNIPNYSLVYLANNSSLTEFKSEVFEVEFLHGNNVFLAFLSDKNNISIKTNKASVLKNVVLGGVESLFDMEQPHLFYYLPQGQTQEPILDFYLTNTSIAKNANKVKVIINQTEFIINKWAAYKISGLENTLRIQLLDKNNLLINGPFNDSGERKFKVVKE